VRQYRFYSLQHARQVVLDFAVPKPYHVNPKGVDEVCAKFIVLFLIIAGFTIDLDNQFMFTAIKVGDEK
jgi:hypothetical protein